MVKHLLVIVVDVRNTPDVLQVKAHPHQLHLKSVSHMVSWKNRAQGIYCQLHRTGEI